MKSIRRFNKILKGRRYYLFGFGLLFISLFAFVGILIRIISEPLSPSRSFAPVFALTSDMPINQEYVGQAQNEENIIWADSCVGYRMQIEGTGMGNEIETFNPQTFPILDPDAINWMTAQLSGRLKPNQEPPSSVVFTTTSPVITSQPSTRSVEGYTYLATHLEPASEITVEASEPSAQHSLRAIVLYEKHSVENQWWSSYGRTMNRYLYGDYGEDDTYTEILTIDSLEISTDILLTVAIIDNDNDTRPVVLEAEAGGVTQTITETGSTNGDLLNIINLTLPDVPAGTDQVEFTIKSPDGGDSIIVVGYNMSFLCQSLIPPRGSLSINDDEEVTNSSSVTLTIALANTQNIADVCISNENIDQLNCGVPIQGQIDMPWTLSSGNGLKTVYVYLTSVKGVLSVISDTIYLDMPTSPVFLPSITNNYTTLVNPCDHEPNDGFSSAIGPLTPGQVICEEFDNKKHDLYYIDLQSPGRIKVTLTFTGDNPIPENTLSIYDSDKSRIDWEDRNSKRPSLITISRRLKKTGVYYFGVYSEKVDPAVDHSYKLTWDIVP